ncbi:hypothetical protein COOONC_03271 [Cooperia oncophora]
MDGSKTVEAPHRNANQSPIEQRTSPFQERQSKTSPTMIRKTSLKSLRTHNTVPLALVLYPFILLALIPAVFTTHIYCQNGTVIVTPPSQFLYSVLQQGMSEQNNEPNIYLCTSTIRTRRESEGLLCRQNPFTTSLLGNPHCWPEGAILTAISLAAVIVLLALLLGILIRNKWSQLRQSISHHQPTLRTQEDKGTPFTLRHLKPSTFVTGALVVLTICTAQINSCQHFHAHYNAELICDDSNKCTVEYEQELFFNKLHRKVCIMLRYHNNTVGNLKLTLQRTRRICNKETLFFTRNTAAKVYYERRCPFMALKINAGLCSQTTAS